MSAGITIPTNDGKFALVYGRAHAILMRHPEWLAWFFSSVVWVTLVIAVFNVKNGIPHPGSVAYCGRMGTATILNQPGTLPKIWATISTGMVSWMFMIVAMMFPLLNEPIKHIAFSLRRKDRVSGILSFLTGYILTWLLAGIFFLLMPLMLTALIGEQGNLVNNMVRPSGFILAAIWIWYPARPLMMIKCGQTIPIRIENPHLVLDSLFYGLKMGKACLGNCWAPMIALVLAHHNILLMCVVTVVIVYERYLLPHTSKLSGYAWGIIGIALLGIEMLA